MQGVLELTSRIAGTKDKKYSEGWIKTLEKLIVLDPANLSIDEGYEYSFRIFIKILWDISKEDSAEYFKMTQEDHHRYKSKFSFAATEKYDLLHDDRWGLSGFQAGSAINVVWHMMEEQFK